MANENRKKELIQIAAKLFKEKGYHSTTIQDIADELGILKGSLYYYIKSKEDLLFEVVMEAGASLLNAVQNAFYNEGSPKEKLSKAVLYHMECFDTMNDQVTVFFHEISNLPANVEEKCKDFINQYEGVWKKIIEEGVKEGVFRKSLDIPIVLYGILGLCNWTYNWYKSSGRLSIQEISEQYCDMILIGILEDEEKSIVKNS